MATGLVPESIVYDCSKLSKVLNTDNTNMFKLNALSVLGNRRIIHIH